MHQMYDKRIQIIQNDVEPNKKKQKKTQTSSDNKDRDLDLNYLTIAND